MEAVTREDYENLKRLLLNQFIDNRKLGKLKNVYSPEVNSNRRMDCINSLGDLIRLLEKRACVSERNIKVLEEIAIQIDHREYIREMSARHDFPDSSPVQYQFQPPVSNAVIGKLINAMLEVPAVKVSSTDLSFAVENCNSDVIRRIYELILCEIGVKWVDFARALKIKESEMDDIKMKYRNDSKACVREVLDIHSKTVHAREWKFCLLEALSKARRNDLRRDAEKIISSYS